MIADLGPEAAYLSQAELVFPDVHPWMKALHAQRQEIMVQLASPEGRDTASFRQQAAHKLKELKKGYIEAYMALHSKARLGQPEDKRKVSLMQDARLAQLQGLATIDLMPAGQLADFQNDLAGLKSCFSLTGEDLRKAPLCPHCQFKPASEPAGPSAMTVLDHLDERLDLLLSEWTRTLLDNLEDPITRTNLDLLKPEARQRVDAFLRSRALPYGIDQAFIAAIRETLSGLSKVTVTMDDLWAVLLSGGSPVTPGEMSKRFELYLAELTKGKDPGKLRIVLE